MLAFIEEKSKFFEENLAEQYPDSTMLVNIGLPFVLINKLVSDKKEKMFSTKYNISTSEFDVLMTLLCHIEPMSPTNLYESMIFSSGGMTKLLKKLEEKNLIRRIPSQKDKRSLLVLLSKEGEKLVTDAFGDVVKINTEVLSKLDESEQATLEKLLKKLLTDFI
ncbi:MarR family winged helix-turn-helix transcriptional regulator [Sulfurovum mangrovi]|uniref:MarR family winged helix-turn-helix transcriptional regulator n=1 Tax=Sulfurovum mangrovi TaxID=2893889 RepID=UPI001E44852F|nr:MarR family transcriptional regulator [Sulfurovum mangrovi]UFH58285.1 MarR family transcriptional regulator [Sulfurovum mangrovi]